MTHATVFLKGSRAGAGGSQFNEELATFVGREGSLLYLASVHGPAAPELAEAEADRADREAFSAYLAGTARELEKVYASGLGEAEKRARKAKAETLEACMASSITQAREGTLYLMCGGREYSA